MKKVLTIIILSLITLSCFSQNDSIIYEVSDPIEAQIALEEFYSVAFAIWDFEVPPIVAKSDDTELRGKLYEIFDSKEKFMEYMTDYKGELRFLDAPETNWYIEGEVYTGEYHRRCGGAIMIDSTVENYYNTMVKDFEYDRYEYEIREHDDGIVQEYYEFYKDGIEIRSYVAGWSKTEFVILMDFNTDTRR